MGCPLSVVLPQIFFNFTTLFSYPVFFCLFHASLDVVHFLVFLRSFRFESCLSQFSPFVAQIKKGFCLSQCLPRISLAGSVTAVLKVVIIESMSVSSLFMMVRGANFPPIKAWRVSNTLGSFSFSRSNLSPVCFGLLILFRRRWKVTTSKLWSLSLSVPGKLRVLELFTPGRKRLFWLRCCPFGLSQVHFLNALLPNNCWFPTVMSTLTDPLQNIFGKDRDTHLRRSRRHCQHWRQDNHNALLIISMA